MVRRRFTPSNGATYDDALGPAVFEPYAIETARRLAALGSGPAWLELAAGTGRATRRLVRALGANGSLVATDLEAGMLEIARAAIPDPRVRFAVADAMALPFSDASFDVAASQFGVMFYHDREAGHIEARRVLRPDGTYLFVTWAGTAGNPMFGEVRATMRAFAPETMPWVSNVPTGYEDEPEIRRSLERAGFRDVAFERVPRLCVVDSAATIALGFIEGTPLASEIALLRLDPEAVAAALTERLIAVGGDGPFRCEMLALYVVASGRG